MTEGWKLCVQWKDGSTNWELLSDMKEAYPVQTAEYAIANELDHQPTFAWWVGITFASPRLDYCFGYELAIP
jgi:hypothetical protein